MVVKEIGEFHEKALGEDEDRTINIVTQRSTLLPLCHLYLQNIHYTDPVTTMPLVPPKYTLPRPGIEPGTFRSSV